MQLNNEFPNWVIIKFLTPTRSVSDYYFFWYKN